MNQEQLRNKLYPKIENQIMEDIENQHNQQKQAMQSKITKVKLENERIIKQQKEILDKSQNKLRELQHQLEALENNV